MASDTMVASEKHGCQACKVLTCMKYWYWERGVADKADALKLRNEKEKELLMQHWQYLVVETGWFGFNNTQLAARLVNGQELKDWKKTPLHLFLTQLGAD